MSSYNSHDALDLSNFGISKFYFYGAWLLTTLAVVVIAYYAGPQDRALERAVGASIFMTGIAVFPYIRGYMRQRAIRRAAKRQIYHQKRQVHFAHARQCVWRVVKFLATLSMIAGINWYTFDYMGIEVLPAWQTALLMLAYVYLIGSLVREFALGNALLLGSERAENSTPSSKS